MERTIASTIRLLLFACCLGGMMQVFSQKGAVQQKEKHVPGEMIVWLKKDADAILFWETMKKRQLSKSLNIVLLDGFLPETENIELEIIQNHPDVLFAQFNHYVQHRATLDSLPADPNVSQQWNLANIHAPAAWEHAQGGLTACGDSIALAIVDDGTDLTHEDFFLWKNRNEIPGNNRDDDFDGYVDNYQGWDAFTQTGATQPSTFHGTATAGIMAARGNNNRGMAGVAWNSKIIPIAGASGDEATVVASYAYALDQRRRYDASGGREGAFVVAINSSFGVDNGDPANFPIWCAMYDTLGAAGILSVSSVANSNLNLDQNNDMPTGCGSEFLITVTATDQSDIRTNGTAWGRTTVDLGAPGRAVPCTAPNDGYSNLSGSSAAAPQVTGAIALLMDRAGDRFMSLYTNRPDSAAKAMKSMILESVDLVPDLQDSTVSGGRLNLERSIAEMDIFEMALPDCFAPFRLFAYNITDSRVDIRWKGPEADSFLVRVKTPDSTFVQTATDSFFTQNNLKSCSLVSFEVLAKCMGDSSAWSSPLWVKMKGCCIPPERLYAPDNEGDSLKISWQPVFGVDSFLLRWQVNDTLWNELVVHDTLVRLGGLSPCSILRYQLASFCDTGLSISGDIVEESTGGCGSCTEKQFCEAYTVDPGGDWIERITLGPLDNQSGNNNGYADFASSATRLESGKRYALRLEPGFASSPFVEYWRIWLDANQSGSFDDPGELIFDAGISSDTVLLDSVTIPASAWGGTARLRVRMRFVSAPEACGGIGFGETEDYCVVIDDFTGLEEDVEGKSLMVRVFPNPTSNLLHMECKEIPLHISLFDIQGKKLFSTRPDKRKSVLDLKNFSAGLYMVQVEINGQRTVKLVRVD